MTHDRQILWVLWDHWPAMYASAARGRLVTSRCMNPRIAYLSLYEYTNMENFATLAVSQVDCSQLTSTTSETPPS